MTATTRWGILGTGSIAKKFAQGLAAVPDADLVAVGSRRQETADAFGDQFHVPRRHAGYRQLAEDPEVDVIYISTPHAFHMENTLLCLEAGKAVLCEKPFAINAAQARRMVEAARGKGLFLMEAMWTRFFPLMAEVRRWLAEGLIGDVRIVSADFGFRAAVNPQGRLFNPALGGGALLDVGVYTVSLASMVLGGPPQRVASLANLGETGVDEQSAMLLDYEDGAMAVLYTAVRARTLQSAEVLGTEGYIRIEPSFWRPDRAVFCSARETEGKPREVHRPYEGNGYNYEAVEVARCLREGRTESEIMPLDESVAVMETLDRIREPWGLRYPME